jgi:hypothetical protein
MLKYLSRLTTGRLILWCYLIWYLVVLVRYFDSSAKLWLTSLGISVIVGVALIISTSSSAEGTRPLDFWQRFRLFLMPFCVSSFAALVKGHGFVLIFSPKPVENVLALGICLLMCASVALIKRLSLSA